MPDLLLVKTLIRSLIAHVLILPTSNKIPTVLHMLHFNLEVFKGRILNIYTFS
jgi:hypothetical protein